MLPLIEETLRLPGAILVTQDVESFRNPENVGYEVGLQHGMKHQRFANFFRKAGRTVMYFKHGADAEIAYQQHPGAVWPSDVAPKYWSAAAVEEVPVDVSRGFLHSSYQSALRKLPMGRRAEIEAIASDDWSFLEFHAAGLCAMEQEGGYLGYGLEPAISDRNGRAAARFSLNWLEVRLGGTEVARFGARVQASDWGSDWSCVSYRDRECWGDLILAATASRLSRT